MRIVHFLWSMSLEDGGVVRALLDLCPALASAGHQIVLLTCRGRDKDIPADWARREPEGAFDPGPPMPSVVLIDPLRRFNRLGPAALDAARRLLPRADVVHIHGMWMCCNDQVARVASRLGVPYIWSTHGMLDDWCMAQRGLKKRLYMAAFERSILARAAAVHCTAEAELRQASKWFPPSKGHVVPLLFDLSPYRQLPGPEEAFARFKLPARATLEGGGGEGREPVVLFLSRIHRKKGVEVLIDACAELRSSGRPCTLVVAGTGDEPYLAELRARAAERSIADHVKFVGFVSGTLKASLYQAADLFVLPSSQENFGFVVVEAMMCRTPVITTKGVATWPEVAESGGGVIVEPTPPSPAGLARAIREMLADEPARADRGEKARAYVSRRLDPSRIIPAFADMYRAAAATRPAVTPA